MTHKGTGDDAAKKELPIIATPVTTEQFIRERTTMRDDLKWAKTVQRDSVNIVLAPGHVYAATLWDSVTAAKLVAVLNRPTLRDPILALFNATTLISGRSMRSFINDAVEEAVNYRMHTTHEQRVRCARIASAAMMCGFSVGEGSVYELLSRPGHAYDQLPNDEIVGLLIDQTVRGHYLGSLRSEQPVVLAGLNTSKWALTKPADVKL